MTTTNKTPASRYWCFTENDPAKVNGWPYDFEHCTALPDGVIYIVFQVEEAPYTNKWHLQGYVQLERNRQLPWLKKNVSDTAHFEVQRGSNEQARDYCMKDESRLDGPYELGDFKPSRGRQGERNDLLKCKDMVEKEGATLKQLMSSEETFVAAIKYHNGLNKFIQFHSKQRDPSNGIENICIVGPPGAGKSHYAATTYPDAYRKTKSQWWDGYSGQDVVIYDDFNSPWFEWDEFMKILDIYPISVQVKGSTINLANTVNVFTSNVPPTKWFKNEKFKDISMIRALCRRFSDPMGKVITMNADHTYEVDTQYFTNFLFELEQTQTNTKDKEKEFDYV